MKMLLVFLCSLCSFFISIPKAEAGEIRLSCQLSQLNRNGVASLGTTETALGDLEGEQTPNGSLILWHKKISLTAISSAYWIEPGKPSFWVYMELKDGKNKTFSRANGYIPYDAALHHSVNVELLQSKKWGESGYSAYCEINPSAFQSAKE